MDLNDFYNIRDPLSDRPFRGTFDTNESWLGLCDGRIKPKSPVIVKHYAGSKVPGDVIWTGALTTIINENVINVLLKYNLKGWDTYQVTVLSHNDEHIPDYYGFAVTGRSGPFNYNRSQITYITRAGGIIPYVKGVSFDIDTWDGSDLFMGDIEGCNHFVTTTKKLVQIFKKEKIKNLRFESITDCEYGASNISPDKLPPELRKELYGNTE